MIRSPATSSLTREAHNIAGTKEEEEEQKVEEMQLERADASEQIEPRYKVGVNPSLPPSLFDFVVPMMNIYDIVTHVGGTTRFRNPGHYPRKRNVPVTIRGSNEALARHFLWHYNREN